MNNNEGSPPDELVAIAPVVLIPALSPGERLVALVRDLLEYGLPNVIVVDDGSPASSAYIFDELALLPQCTVLHHDENRGKGRALKTGMQYFLEHFPGCVGVVTADCDGQHTPAAIRAVADELSLHPGDLALGVRDFSGVETPPKSRLGNTLTKWLFKLLTGLSLADTQTGLRGIPAPEMERLCALKGERFEYELNMLLDCHLRHVPIRQVPIATVYLDGNTGTHFNPFTDSVRVYLVLLKFASSSLVSFAVDYSLFLVFLAVFGSLTASVSGVFWAGIASRVLSSTVNYTLNRLAVFQSNAKLSTVRYYILWLALMLASSGSVTGLQALFGGGAPLFKIIVDSLLFFVSFTIQREWVFASPDNASPDDGDGSNGPDD